MRRALLFVVFHAWEQSGTAARQRIAASVQLSNRSGDLAKAIDIVFTYLKKAGSKAVALLRHMLRRIAFTDAEKGTIQVAFEKETLYWNEKFGSDDYTLTRLPYSMAPSSQAPIMSTVGGSLSEKAAQRVLQMSKGAPLAAFMILLAGVQSLLHKYTGASDILVGIQRVRHLKRF